MVKDHEWKMITLSNVLLDSQLHKRERLLPQSYHLAPRLGVKCIQIYTSQFFGVQFVCMLIGFQKVLFFFFFNPLGTLDVQAKCSYTHDRAISSLWKVLLDRNNSRANIDFLRIVTCSNKDTITKPYTGSKVLCSALMRAQ